MNLKEKIQSSYKTIKKVALVTTVAALTPFLLASCNNNDNNKPVNTHKNVATETWSSYKNEKTIKNNLTENKDKGIDESYYLATKDGRLAKTLHKVVIEDSLEDNTTYTANVDAWVAMDSYALDLLAGDSYPEYMSGWEKITDLKSDGIVDYFDSSLTTGGYDADDQNHRGPYLDNETATASLKEYNSITNQADNAGVNKTVDIDSYQWTKVSTADFYESINK